MQTYHVAVSHSMGPRIKGPPGHSSLMQPRRLQSTGPQRLLRQQPVVAQQGRRKPSAATTRASSVNVNETVTFGPQKDALLTTDSIDDFGVFNFAEEIAYLQEVVDRLSAAPSIEQKVEVILREPRAQIFFNERSMGMAVKEEVRKLPLEDAFVLYCLPVINQWEVLGMPPPDGDWPKALLKLSEMLRKCNVFYDAIGGLIGYQLKVCQLVLEGLQQDEECDPTNEECMAEEPQRQCFLEPPSLDLSQDQAAATAAAVVGLKVLPEMAEVIPLGGAGDRLGLQCEETGESLPTAMLTYCGRTLLENIVRDLQGREYLYYRIYGKQQTTPVAVMTSDAKGNNSHINELLRKKGWFGRGEGSFRLFCQPLVPVVSVEDSKWLLPEPFEPMLKPGGHGVIWKLMADAGVFGWLEASGREAALVRQISNPLAGTDTTLLALAGTGRTRGHSFGFASCERAVGAAEGMNVLVEEQVRTGHGSTGGTELRYGITNVEYTEFERLGITDEASGDGTSTSMYPANTNILYVGLKQVVDELNKGFVKGGGAVLPGMIFNLNKKVAYTDALTGVERNVRAGRMECTMQNLADCFRAPLDSVPQNTPEDSKSLDTFLVYNLRKRTTSSAKRKRKPGTTKIHQTPDGSFYDLQGNGRDLLAMCGMAVPELRPVAEYLDKGPSFIFLFNPALGPLWDVVTQKIRGGSLGCQSELVLEVAEVDMQDVVIEDGSSLRVAADTVMGRVSQPAQLNGRMNGVEVQGELPDEMLLYSDQVGRVRMHNVTVSNDGIDWEAPGNTYWQHRVARRQSCEVILHGNAEFEAVGCELSGDLLFEVPDGHRLRVTANGGGLVQDLQPLGSEAPSWTWSCTIPEGEDRVVLEMQEGKK